MGSTNDKKVLAAVLARQAENAARLALEGPHVEYVGETRRPRVTLSQADLVASTARLTGVPRTIVTRVLRHAARLMIAEMATGGVPWMPTLGRFYVRRTTRTHAHFFTSPARICVEEGRVVVRQQPQPTPEHPMRGYRLCFWPSQHIHEILHGRRKVVHEQCQPVPRVVIHRADRAYYRKPLPRGKGDPGPMLLQRLSTAFMTGDPLFDAPDLVDAVKMAQLMNVRVDWVRAAACGDPILIPSVKIGIRRRYSPRAVLASLAERYGQHTGPHPQFPNGPVQSAA